ncbi:hypothetical protein ACFYVR_00165 [Rhodococcus sp. NPDC003318]|uniref:hypothetical protein n=1 Tax=Rhodococcus sp. NPDC003318 TaxID=3364503 RepID=UPI00368434CF
MSATLTRIVAVTALTVGIGALVAPTATAKERPLGNGSLAICFVVPLPGSADVEWCL